MEPERDGWHAVHNMEEKGREINNFAALPSQWKGWHEEECAANYETVRKTSGWISASCVSNEMANGRNLLFRILSLSVFFSGS